MDGVVFPLWAGDIREPLGGEAGPLQGVCHYQVIEEGCVFLPYFVLFINDAFLHRLIICCVCVCTCVGVCMWVGRRQSL